MGFLATIGKALLGSVFGEGVGILKDWLAARRKIDEIKVEAAVKVEQAEVWSNLAGVMRSRTLGQPWGYTVGLLAGRSSIVLPRAQAPTWAQTLASALWCVIAVVGALAMVAPMVIGARRRKLKGMLKLLPLLPVYNALLGLAAAMALVDLFRRPHHWAKTTHGLARSSLRNGRIG